MPNENPQLKNVNRIQRGGSTSPEAATVGITRSEFAKKVGIAAFLVSASLVPGSAVAGCIGDEFTVVEGTGGTGGKGPNTSATSTANGGTGGENVGGAGTSSGVSGTGGMENTGGQGGTGGVNVGGQGGTGGENVGGQGGAGTGGTGGVNVGGGGAGGAECVGKPVKLKNMAEYVAIVYRGGCDPANRAFTSYADGSATFNTGTLDLCLEPGDVPMIQVKDGTDKNALEFESAVVPTEVQVKKVPSGTPVSYAEMDALCASTTDYSLVSDVNPAATGFKYEGNSVTDPTDAYRAKF